MCQHRKYLLKKRGVSTPSRIAAYVHLMPWHGVDIPPEVDAPPGMARVSTPGGMSIPGCIWLTIGVSIQESMSGAHNTIIQ